jgi:DNA-binding MarR family transcriptional regulator
MTETDLHGVDDFLDLMATQSRIEQALSRRLRREGSGISEYRVLRLLSRSPDREIRLLDLTEALGLEQSSVSRLVVRLEQSGDVRREPCGDDRRGVFCVLTEAGATRERHLTPIFADTLTAAVQPSHTATRDTDSTRARTR